MGLRPRAGGSTETSGAIVEGEVFGEGLFFGEGDNADVEEEGAGSEAEGASLDDGAPAAAGVDGTSVIGGGRGVSRNSGAFVCAQAGRLIVLSATNTKAMMRAKTRNADMILHPYLGYRD